MKDFPEVDVTKDAAKYLKLALSKRGIQVGVSHSQAVIAHYLGHRSRTAMLNDDDINIDCDTLTLQHNGDLRQMAQGIERMRTASPFQSMDVEALADDVRAALTPPCECCGQKKIDVMPLGYEPDPWSSDIDGWICRACADNDDDYAACLFCRGAVYRSEDINAYGECDVHEGESVMDFEDE
jgi:hypothetical protein